MIGGELLGEGRKGEGAFTGGGLAKEGSHFWHGGEHPEERNPSFLPFSTVQRAPKVRYTNFRRAERRIWGWASCESGVVAEGSGRRSGELLKLQGDLDLHVWRKMDHKFYKGSLQEGPVVGGYPDTLIIIQSHVEKDELCGERSRRSWSMFRFGHSEGTNLVNGMKYFGSVIIRKSRSHHKCITSRDRSSMHHPDECLVGNCGGTDKERLLAASGGRGTWTNRTYTGMRRIWRLYRWYQSLASPSTVWFEDEPSGSWWACDTRARRRGRGVTPVQEAWCRGHRQGAAPESTLESLVVICGGSRWSLPFGFHSLTTWLTFVWVVRWTSLLIVRWTSWQRGEVPTKGTPTLKLEMI
ncbi:hypothetical protein LR48_Vigan05g036700 [Vigna angularis]|uniref:Uncharacterized protein n=1 Tax=Phaseolus angularis TaxID=3914 RepID=A0A0L9UJ15_PHAAN|nr:hypothetical protein LR48_Vigan05g036700 [Vigna angularis]